MFAVHIDLNYEDYAEEECREIWEFIQSAMEQAGFHLHGRRFCINESHDAAIELAKDAIDNLEPHQDFASKRVYRFIKEFYGYSMDNVTNFLTPTTDMIMVDEIDPDSLNEEISAPRKTS